MEQCGRRSAAALAAIAVGGSSLPLEPPEGMNAREQAEWRTVVDRLGSDWFPRETLGLLRLFCGLTVQLDDVSRTLAGFDKMPDKHRQPEEWDWYCELTRMRGAVGGQLMSVATKLRLTTQSRSHPRTAYTEAKRRPLGAGQRPWEDDDVPSRAPKARKVRKLVPVPQMVRQPDGTLESIS